MRYYVTLINVLFILNLSICQEMPAQQYTINNASYFSGYKGQVAAYTMRKLYGEAFNKWVDIKGDRGVFTNKYIWSMNNAAEYMIRTNCNLIQGAKPQTLNLALGCLLSPVLDSITFEYYKNDSLAMNNNISFIAVHTTESKNMVTHASDTIVLYHENAWCRAFKYLVIQHIFSYFMGEGGEFDQTCLSQDGSQEANLQELGNSGDYLKITREVANEVLSIYKYDKDRKGNGNFYPAFNLSGALS